VFTCKRKIVCWATTLSLMLLAGVGPARADTVSCDFASEVGSSIEFNGTNRTFEFPSTSPYDFVIAATSPDLGGLQGNIGGTFTVGTITFPGVGEQLANVASMNGTFSVYDGAGNTLTANLNWETIQVLDGLFGILNVEGVANLTNISYAGNNNDLLGIKDGSDQTVVLTFQFSPVTSETLTELMTPGQVSSTSYSGSLSSSSPPPVPEPSSCMLLVTAGLGLLTYTWRRRTRTV
jgi:hypothetical protein